MGKTKTKSTKKKVLTQQNNNKTRVKNSVTLKHSDDDSSSNNYDDSSSNNYEVDKIIGVKKVGRQKLFLVSWKGYGASENTWEKEEDLKKCKESINAFIDSLSEKRHVDNVEILAAYANKNEVGYKAKRKNGEVFEIIGEKKIEHLKSILVYLESLIKFSK